MENPSFSSARHSSDPLIGELIDERYRVERVLGTGGTGTVYLAEHVRMEKRVALKVLHATHAVISSAMDRFQREAIALARIAHPNVVTATDFGTLKNGAYYLALEYVEGVSLGEILAHDGALPVNRALAIAYQVASALQAAHSQNIVHRDLKPLNVMLTQVGGVEVVKVLDFGLAKLRSKLTQGSISMSAGQLFGTPHYMAPEQITGEGVDERTDLYSLGVLLYEMLSGRPPFDAKDLHEILALQATAEPEPLSEAISPALRTLVTRLLAKSQDDRPRSASEVLTLLEPLMVRQSSIRLPAQLRRELGLFGIKLPVWAVALPAAAFVAIFLVGLLLASEPPVAPSPSQAPTQVVVVASGAAPKPRPPAPDRAPALIADAEFGKDAAISELLKTPPAARDRELWLVLAKGRLKQGNVLAAVELLREAVHLNPAWANDEEIAQLLRMAANDDKAAKLALATAADLMGSRGVDILFSVWADTRRRTPTTALAEQYLQQQDVRSRASKPLRLALELRGDLECKHALELVREAEKIGDTRALRPLASLRKQRGCGPGSRSDCYGCLRDGDDLENAIAAAAKRVGPKF